MTPLAVRPFMLADVPAAAAMLAARHTRDRGRDSRLPPEFQTVEACVPRIEAVSADGFGVAAVRGGRLVGYLVARASGPREALRRAYVPLEGHALGESEDGETYRQMYAALAPALIRMGLFDHQVHIEAADGLASDAFFTLTFGQGFHVASRGLDGLAREGAGCQVRLARPSDAQDVVQLIHALDAQGAETPGFMPALGPAPDVRDQVLAASDREDKAVLLAAVEGRTVGMMYLGKPEEPGLDRGPDSAHIFQAIVAPATRSQGIGTALLQHCVAWARENGYRRLSLDYRSHNLQGARFWSGHGFRPVSTILQRRIDPRVAWADGTNQ